jgi:CDP-paratose 2-epimerase
MRRQFFGDDGSTVWNLENLKATTRRFSNFSIDVRNRDELNRLFIDEGPFDLIVHCAGQPSHDWAAQDPALDFEVNALGTINLLQALRDHSSDAVFVFMSTNKVYGDAPNELPLKELATRWEYAREEDYGGITECMRIDRSKHSVFGASKVAADVMTQEYGRYFGLKTTCFRAGCMTGPNHSGVELHGFLSYLVKAQLSGRPYCVYGYKGKQVRDNIHSLDVARAVEAVYENPRSGAVYNLGGGRENACSILEGMDRIAQIDGVGPNWSYSEQHRDGDHICYISDLVRFRRDYPQWSLTRSLNDIFEELCSAWHGRIDRNGKMEHGAAQSLAR